MPPAWLRPAILILTALLLLTWFSGEIADTDIWLHLMTGRNTLQTHALTVPDPFSYTSSTVSPAYPGEAKTRYFNLTHEWLAQIDEWGIAYYSNGTVRGIDLSKVFRFDVATAPNFFK